MSLSFEESLKVNKKDNVIPENMIATANMIIDDIGVAAPSIMTLDESYGIAAYSGEDGNWQQHNDYVRYSAFSDDNLSVINDTKDINLNTKQFNITQEENSQYIPFEMPRYYDGFDLVNTTLSIHYNTEGGRHGVSKPVNVTFNDEKIRFGWLIDAGATLDVGTLKFEIHAYGTITGSDGIPKAYTWKTKSNKNLNVLESMCDCEGAINNIDDTWLQELVDDIAEKIADEIKNVAVGEQVKAAENAAASAEQFADSARQYAENASNAATESVNRIIADYATTDYVDEAIAGVDVTEQLASYVKTTDLESNYYNKTDVVQLMDSKGYATTDYVDNAIAEADISSKLNDYYTKSETYSQSEIDTKLSNVKVDLTGYATETYVDNKTGILSSDVATNKENISSISKTLGELQEDISAIDNSPRLTYDVAYNDAEDEDVGENVFVLYEITNEGKEDEVREAKKKFTIVGGSGGGSGSVLKISYVTMSPVVATINDKVLITYNFSGTDSSGDVVPEGNYTWKIGSKIIASGIATNGENTFDATDFATTTSQKFTLTITDDAGSLATKSWTVQKVDVRLESSFSDVYPKTGDISFPYTPHGAVEKDIHFVLDGTELGVVKISTSGIPTSYPIPAQTHGSHLLEVYMTAKVNGKTIGLEEIVDENGEIIGYNHTIKVVKDILWQDPTDETPIIGCATTTINVMQYNPVGIKYVVLDPNTETPKVTWSINGKVVSEETLTEKDEDGYYVYPYKANEAGTFVLTISCGEAEPKTITVNVEKLNINVSPVTAGLEFDFNPVGYSNNSADRLWSNNDVTMTVSENFDWVNGGYQIDENGDQYFCVKAGTSAVINYNLFADDPKKTGKEFKLIFRTKNIRKRDTSFLTCIDNNIGLDMKVEHATVYDSGGSLKSNYCEDTIIEYEFNINKDTDMMIVMSYEDGTPSKPYEYKETSSFKQPSPKPIIIGSADCDVHIYRMKAYSTSLTDTDIKNNFIADARNANEIIARYTRNQIYNEDSKVVSTSASGDFNVDALMKAAPDLRYIFLEVPQFTNDKDNKIDGCTVYFRYPAGTRPQDNWTCTGVRHRGQGTSSNLYGYAGRNIDLCMDRDESLFTWVDEEGETVESSTITLTDTSVPTDYLNIKVNIASSENANNAQLARRFNEYQPFLRYARKKDSRVKDTMEFYNCVVFIRETSTDLSNTPHREFNDTDWHFYAIGNVGDSKKTDDTRVNNKRDPKEHIVEITDADKPLSAFPTGKDGNAVCPVNEWKAGNTAYDILHSTEYVYDEEGAFESFGGKTYEFRYEMKNITEEQREANINAWRDLYKFIVTSTDEEFYANLKNYFVVDSALYFYLFTERYTMVDNRAKNSFWHYGKVYISETEAATLGEIEASYYIIDNDAAAINDGYRYDLTQGYDMDTALGIDNTGDYVFSYGKEDTDYYVDGDPTSDYVFRVADSVFFCRLRELFPSEMQAMFKNREEKNAWNSTSLIDQWDNSQAQFPEELWRLDYERKYYRTYLGLSIDNSINTGEGRGVDKSFLIGKFFGRKKYARRAFEPNQEIYFATKYFGNKALSDVFWIRGNVPIGSSIKPNYSLTLVPYSDMYVCVQYTSTGTPIHQKVKAGETCYFENNSDRMDFIYVYAASFIQEVGDLSRCYVGDNNFSSATRLQKLVIGSTDDGYENTFMKEVLVANNPLLEHLDLRNISGINTVIDVSGCSNLKELYAEGTNATGAIFANGGLLHTAHLPSLTSLSMKNLNYIEDFVVDGYGNLQTLIIENTPNINTYNIVVGAPSLRLLRLINLNWDFVPRIENASIFDRLLDIGGIDSSGYETDLAVLTGIASVAVIGQYDLYKYQEAWSDLTIEATTIKPQFKVTFVNDDGTVLDTQYIEQFESAIDPITRDENPIAVPTKNSTIQHSYAYAGWDSALTNVVADRIITATYTESLREYTVKYVSKGIVVKTASGLYGDNIVYDGETPVYTAEEPYAFYLFNRWDKSGFLNNGIDENGVKTINAIFDKFTYSATAFDGKELADLSPVEIYAMNKLNESGTINIQNIITDKDPYTIIVGNDIDYDDVDSELLISEKTHFDGYNYIDTGIQLFDNDKDFVLAIDYEFLSGNKTNSVLAQCFQSNGTNGFKLWYGSSNGSSGARFTWGTTSDDIVGINKREIIVIRHKKGDNNLMIYKSNLDGNEVLSTELTRTKSTVGTGTLVFGSARADDGIYENHAIGNINWAKVWFADLGDDVCKNLAMWTHESIVLEACGFRKYYLSNNRSKRCSFSLLASHLLGRTKKWNNSNSNAGGWAGSELNYSLNTRLYNAMPTQIKSLLKQVVVYSSIGQMSYETSSSNCYITIPALIEVDPTQTSEPYNSEGISISYLNNNDSRKRTFDGGDYSAYWTRSPNVGYTNYIWRVDENGDTQGITNATTSLGVLIELSF